MVGTWARCQRRFVDELIQLVRTYRVTDGLTHRLRLAEQIFTIIEPDLRVFVFSAVSHHVGQDVFQEVLKAVAVDLGKFKGNTNGEFWAWCYRIARNKLNDQYRKQDRIQPVPNEVLWELIDASARTSPLSPGDRLDLEYAMQLLSASKPDCYDFLWKHFVLGFDYDEIAAEKARNYDATRMKIARCLEAARALVA